MRLGDIMRRVGSFVLTCALSLWAFGATTASTFQSGDNIHITHLHRIQDDLYTFGSNITVDGFVDGDLTTGGYEVYSNGQVMGAQNTFAYKLHHSGSVNNSLRAFAYTLIVDGRIGRSLVVFAYDTHIGKGAMIERDAHIRGYTTRVQGKVGRDLDVKGQKVVITGWIGGNVSLEAEEISIQPPAFINGDLTYCCVKKITIDTTAGVTILGETKGIQPTCETDEEEGAGFTVRSMVLPLAKVLAAFLFGIIAVFVFRRQAEVAFEQLRTRFTIAIAAGFLTLIVLVLAVVVLAVSAVLSLVGLALVSGELASLGAVVLVLSLLLVPITAFATVSGGIVFYSGKIVVAFLIGYLLVRLVKAQPTGLGKMQLLLGLIILALLFAIPYAGMLIYLLVTVAGAGAIVIAIRKCRPEHNRTQPALPGSNTGQAEAPPAQ